MEHFINWILKSSEDLQFILYFGVLFTLIIAEQVLHFRPIVRKGRWLANFSMTAIAICTMLIIPFSFISSAAYAQDKHWGLFNIIRSNMASVVIATLLLRGFISFITHYLMHKIPLFWRVHRVHHLDTELDVSTTVRFHPLEFFINTAIGVPIILLFGFPAWVLMLYELLDVIITLISHANISLPEKLDRILRYVIVTPDLHRVHHSSFQPETDSNFSAVFPIWDLVFGTLRFATSRPQKEMELGLEEVRDERTNSISWLMLSPFKNLRSNHNED